MRLLLRTMWAAALLAASSCSESAGPGAKGVLVPETRDIGMTYIGQAIGRGRLDINPSAVNFNALGQSVNLSHSIVDASGAPIPSSPSVNFQSLNSGVATVSSFGQVLARAMGKTAIVATSLCCSGDTTPVNVGETPPPPAGLLVSAKWSTATGNTVQAVTDGGKAIDPRWCAWNQILSVVPGGPVGFTRTANVLAVHRIDGCGHVEFENLFPLPTTQEQFWAVRYYVMNGPGQTHSEQHPFCFWPVGSIEAVHLAIDAQAGGNWNLGAGWGAGNYNQPQGGAGGPRFPWFPMDGGNRRVLAAGTWYRYEFILQWLNATQYRVYPRLYDMAGNLLNDHTNWRHSDGAGSYAEFYANGGYFTRSANSNGADHIRTISFGMGQTGSSGGYYYVADFAAALVNNNSDFIGTSP